MSARKVQDDGTPPDLTPERAFSLLSDQLDQLQSLKMRNHGEAKTIEKEWYQFTERLVSRSFGSKHPNLDNFQRCWSAVPQQRRAFGYRGPVVDSYRQQSNFEARLVAFESVLKNCLQELRLDMPDTGIKGVYEPGEEYEFYRDVTACLNLAQKEIFVVDPYLNADIFNVYATAISRSVIFRLLSAKIPGDTQALAQKYAAGGNFALRSSNSIHDRVLFADNRVWVSGQSLKDAAKKKPTYIVELDESLMRPIYEGIWQAAAVML